MVVVASDQEARREPEGPTQERDGHLLSSQTEVISHSKQILKNLGGLAIPSLEMACFRWLSFMPGKSYTQEVAQQYCSFSSFVTGRTKVDRESLGVLTQGEGRHSCTVCLGKVTRSRNITDPGKTDRGKPTGTLVPDRVVKLASHSYSSWKMRT